MRFGITILPEYRWKDAEPRWRRAEELGFDHVWTYDHLTWGGLQDSPWYGTTPTLTAAALVTSTIRLGTFVTSPNFRHPLALTRDILALDDVSDGRFLCGIGSGGGIDATIQGGPELTAREKVDRLTEFVELLDKLLTTDGVDYLGEYFETRNGRTLPGCVQQPRVPLVRRPARAGDRLEPGAPVVGRRGVQRRELPERAVDHEVQQLGLGRDVGVEGHRADAEVGGEAAHRERPEALGVRERDRGVHHAVDGEPGLGTAAAGGRLHQPPQQGQAAGRVAGAGDLRHDAHPPPSGTTG